MKEIIDTYANETVLDLFLPGCKDMENTILTSPNINFNSRLENMKKSQDQGMASFTESFTHIFRLSLIKHISKGTLYKAFDLLL